MPQTLVFTGEATIRRHYLSPGDMRPTDDVDCVVEQSPKASSLLDRCRNLARA